MELRDTPEQAPFRAEARAFLRASLPPGWGTPTFAKPRRRRMTPKRKARQFGWNSNSSILSKQR